MLEAVVPEYSGAGEVREPSGSTIKGIVPSNTYRCNDGKLVIIGANTKGMFERLMRVIGRDDFADDKRLAINSERVVHEKAIDEAIAKWVATLPLKEVTAILKGQAVAVGPILNVEDMFADPHYQARGAFEEVSVNGEILHIPSIAPRLEETPGRTDRPGPQLGEHTDRIFKDLLGLDDETLKRLRHTGTI
jgi:crotonobetainyl-CoA:carnitine CoA-transferase CaiB-like acyl-CoA transferase